MRVRAYRRDRCRLCDSSKLEVVVKLEPTPPGDDFVLSDRLGEVQETYPLDIALCSECGNTQLMDIVSPEAIYDRYKYVTSISLGLPEHFARYAEDIMERIAPPAGSLVVEMGSNEGALLRALKANGLKVLGVDPAAEIARMATDSGVETLAAYFTAELAAEIRSARGLAAVVAANNVFANIDDVADVIEGIRDLLAPGGVFIMETSYWLDVVDKALLDTIFHEHLSYFSVKPLGDFFRRHGMQLIDAQRLPTKGGSVRITAQLVGGPRRVAVNVGELIRRERERGVQDAARLRGFGASLEAPRKELHEFVQGLKDERKSVAAYGAAVGLTTLIYHYGLGEMLDFIADDYEPKQGRFSPGFHIPVLAPSALYEKKPDYVIVLAWRYCRPIIAKHQSFLKQGGHFVVPLPSVQVF